MSPVIADPKANVAMAPGKLIPGFFLVPKSGWAMTPPSISSGFVPAEWENAGIVQLPNTGFLMLKNDAKYLYVALDVVQDTGNSPNMGDYFWLSFDVDGNAAITVNKDVDYGIYPTLPIRIGRQFYLGKGTWTGILTDPSTSLACQFFGTTPKSNQSHRIWMLRLELAEIGVNFAALTGPPKIRFGLRLSSTTPGFTHDFPENFFNDFSHLMEAWLATAPALPATKGLPIAGVGRIPADKIHTDGRATTDPSYFLPVTNGAFGGIVHVIGDETMMRNLFNNLHVRKYRVKCELPGGGLTDIRQSWSNYRLVPNEGWVLETFGPDVNGMYPMPNPIDLFSIDHLFLQWNTTGFGSGLYKLSMEFFDVDGKLVKLTIPGTTEVQKLPLFVDNNLPDLRILSVRYKGQEVPACAIVKVTDTPDPVQIDIKAFDPEGNLASYQLDALYGDNVTFQPPLAHGVYPGSGNWQGVAQATISVSATGPNKFPPTTCAYEFRLSALPRVTNGYDFVGYTQTTRHVTFERTGTPKILAKRFAREFAAGRDTSGRIAPPPK